mmetsp:Transcript_8888/g.13322  ORF Transcript_8888/g.13322 Transcript_8888/m.13322 type:complete len:309 (+) Transcript_8888:12-938(+)
MESSISLNTRDIEPYVVRTDISASIWGSCLDSLETNERAKVLSFVFKKDQERSLLSILLQKYVILKRFGCTDFTIKRTRENKPYVCPSVSADVGTWNFNASHHGDFVAIVSHDSFLVGLDIVDISTRCNWVANFAEFLEIYRKQLTTDEVKTILSFHSENDRYTHFFVLWALKEAYVKAVGCGIGIDLTKIHFDVTYCTRCTDDDPHNTFSGTAVMTVSSYRRNDWRFDFWSLDATHVIAVSRGPLAEALDTYIESAWPNFASHMSIAPECVEKQLEESAALLNSHTILPPVVLTLDELVVAVKSSLK